MLQIRIVLRLFWHISAWAILGSSFDDFNGFWNGFLNFQETWCSKAKHIYCAGYGKLLYIDVIVFLSASSAYIYLNSAHVLARTGIFCQNNFWNNKRGFDPVLLIHSVLRVFSETHKSTMTPLTSERVANNHRLQIIDPRKSSSHQT